MTHLVLLLISVVLAASKSSWDLAIVLRRTLIHQGRTPARWLTGTVSLLKWPALISVTSQPAMSILLGHRLTWIDYISTVGGAVFWAIYHNDGDDDVWKRLKDRLTGRVKQLGTRLVVVPEPA